MQTHPPLHDSGRDYHAFQRLDYCEHDQHEQRMLPIAELHERDGHGNDENDYRADERNDCQHDRGDAEQYPILETNDKETDSVENAVTDCHKDLAAKKRYKVVVDRADNKNEFV